jgi:hypothetical protein
VWNGGWKNQIDTIQNGNETMNCGQYEPLIALYVEGDLSGRKVRQLEDHLKQCANCRRFAEKIQSSQKFLKTLREKPIEESIFQNLQDQVLARVSGSPSGGLSVGISWLAPTWRWRIPAAAGLALLMAGVVYLTLLSTNPHDVKRKDSPVESSNGNSQQRKSPTPPTEVGSLPSRNLAVPQAETNLTLGQARTRRPLQAKTGTQVAIRIPFRNKNRIISNAPQRLESISPETRFNKPIMFESIQLTPNGKAFEVTRFEPVEVQTIKIDIPESPEQVAIKLPTNDPNIVILWLVDK